MNGWALLVRCLGVGWDGGSVDRLDEGGEGGDDK